MKPLNFFFTGFDAHKKYFCASGLCPLAEGVHEVSLSFFSNLNAPPVALRPGFIRVERAKDSYGDGIWIACLAFEARFIEPAGSFESDIVGEWYRWQEVVEYPNTPATASFEVCCVSGTPPEAISEIPEPWYW